MQELIVVVKGIWMSIVAMLLQPRALEYHFEFSATPAVLQLGKILLNDDRRIGTGCALGHQLRIQSIVGCYSLPYLAHAETLPTWIVLRAPQTEC